MLVGFHDKDGNLTSTTDRNGDVTSYQYDALDRRVFVGYGTAGEPPTYASTITLGYDPGNRLTSLTDSTNGKITVGYDQLDEMTRQQTPLGSVAYAYDAAGRRQTMVIGTQTTVRFPDPTSGRLSDAP